MALPTPEQASQKWGRNAGQARPSYEEGVRNVSQSPTSRAADQVDAWINNVQAARDKYVSGLRRVSLEDWRQAALSKGATRFVSGVQGSTDKMATFMRDFFPHLQQVQNELDGMPRGTLEANIERANHVMRRNAEFRRSR